MRWSPSTVNMVNIGASVPGRDSSINALPLPISVYLSLISVLSCTPFHSPTSDVSCLKARRLFGFSTGPAFSLVDALAAILLALCRIGDKDVLHRATIQDPTDQQLALGMSNGAIIAIEAVVAVPGTHEPVEHLRLVSQRRMGARSSKRLDHILSWIGTLGGGVPKQEPQHACCCNRTENPANCATL